MIEIHPWELLAAAGIFLFTLFLVNRILFRPFMQAIRERQSLTTGRFDESNRLLRKHQQLIQDYEDQIRKEKFENYRKQEGRRNEAIGRRSELIEEARKKAEQTIADARTQVSAQLEQVKASLQSDARNIAATICRALLGREIR